MISNHKIIEHKKNNIRYILVLFVNANHGKRWLHVINILLGTIIIQ